MKWIRKNQLFILGLAVFGAATMLAVPRNCFAQNFIEDRIRIDQSSGQGAGDPRLAREVERFLETNLRCPEQTCDLTIKVSNGRVAIAGIIEPEDRPALNRVGEAIGGIRRLDISGVRSHINPFQRDQGKYIEDHIRVDEVSGQGHGDPRLAREIERFLEKSLRCPEQTCDLTIKVSNGRVAIAGVISPEDRPLLEKVRQNIGGIRSLDLSGVRSHINPFQRDQGKNIGDQIKIDGSVRSGQDLKLAREIERYLEKTLPCKRLCDLTINVSNGRAALAGIILPEDRPLLEKVRENVQGVRSLDLKKVDVRY